MLFFPHFDFQLPISGLFLTNLMSFLKSGLKNFGVPIFFLLIAFLLFYRLGENHLTNWDEAWYADVSRSVARTGDLFSLVWNKEPFYEKPPLYFWLSGLTYRLFGESEFSARFPSAAAGMAVALTMFFSLRALFGKSVAFTSLLILFSSPFFLYRTRTGNFDTLLTLWMTISVFAFLKVLDRQYKWFLIMGGAVAFAFFTKGTIGLYPLLVSFCALIIFKQISLLRSKWFLYGMCLVFISIFAWLLVSAAVNGQEFMTRFFAQNTEKFGLGFSTFSNFSLEYIMFLKNGMKLWVLLFPVAFIFALKQKDVRLAYLALYSILFILFISFSENKSNWYLLPVYPTVAILVGYFLHEFKPPWWRNIFRLCSVVFCITVSLFQVYFFRYEYILPDVSRDEANVAQEAKKRTDKSETLYLTNYYYPTTVYYSERKVFSVYSEQPFNRAWWIRPKSDWERILKKSNVFIITTSEEFKTLRATFTHYTMEIIFRSGDKLLVKKL